MNVESWCQVEANAKESWLRANRKHFPKAMKSTVFVKELPDRFAYKLKPPKQLLEEISRKKHFPQKCKLPLCLLSNSRCSMLFFLFIIDDSTFQI